MPDYTSIEELVLSANQQQKSLGQLVLEDQAMLLEISTDILLKNML